MGREARPTINCGLYYIAHYRPLSTQVYYRETSIIRDKLGEAVEHFRTRAYAYHIDPTAYDYLHYVVWLINVSPGSIARSIENRRGKVLGHFHQEGRRGVRRPRIRLVEPRYLSAVVRYVHWHCVRQHRVTQPVQYPGNSARAYDGVERYPWLSMSDPAHTLVSGDLETASQQKKVSALEPPSAPEIALIEHGNEMDARVIGGAEFVRSLPADLRLNSKQLTLDEIRELVEAAFGFKPEALLSDSQQHPYVVARALLTQHAQQQGYSNARIGRYLGRTGHAVAVACERYQEVYEAMFKLEDLPDDGSLMDMLSEDKEKRCRRK